MISSKFLRTIATSVHQSPLSILTMSAKKVIDTFNQIDQELLVVKNKLDNLSGALGGSHAAANAFAELNRLKEENKNMQREILEIMKQISVYDVLQGKPPLALKVLMKNQNAANDIKTATETAKPAGDSNAPEKQASAVSANETGMPQAKSDKKKTEKSKEDPKEIKQEAKEDTSKKAAGNQSDEAVSVAQLDFRVGKIVEVSKHPDADSLYVEQIDLGEEKPRTVVSGLVKFVPIDQMQNRMVVVLCNLKPAKMRGITSEGMVMCASTPDKVEVLDPPAGSKPGDRVVCPDFPGTPEAQLNPKKKIWETVAPDLHTDAGKVASYKGKPLVVPGKGNVVSQTLVNVAVK